MFKVSGNNFFSKINKTQVVYRGNCKNLTEDNQDSFIKTNDLENDNPKELYKEIQKMFISSNENAKLDYLYNLADYTKLIFGTCSPEDIKKSLQLLIDKTTECSSKSLVKILEIVRNAVYPHKGFGKDIDYKPISEIKTDDVYCQKLIGTILNETENC